MIRQSFKNHRASHPSAHPVSSLPKVPQRIGVWGAEATQFSTPCVDNLPTPGPGRRAGRDWCQFSRHRLENSAHVVSEFPEVLVVDDLRAWPARRTVWPGPRTVGRVVWVADQGQRWPSPGSGLTLVGQDTASWTKLAACKVMMSEVRRDSESGAQRKLQRVEEFEEIYAGAAPWDIGRPQSAFLRMAEAGAWRGRVLDVGCGTGEHALLAASLGLPAPGIDAVPTAIELARRKAEARGLAVRFLVWDAFDLPALGEQFDTVLDCGLFHPFDDANRTRLVEGLRAVVAPGGRYFMLCFSDRQPGDFGPRHVSEAEIRASFADGWQIESIEPSAIESTVSPVGVIAWLATIVRR